jgi:hypothetical protein
MNSRLGLSSLFPFSKVEAYTGRATVRYVSYITAFGQYPGYVVMGLSTTRPATPNPPSATAGE